MIGAARITVHAISTSNQKGLTMPVRPCRLMDLLSLLVLCTCAGEAPRGRCRVGSAAGAGLGHR